MFARAWWLSMVLLVLVCRYCMGCSLFVLKLTGGRRRSTFPVFAFLALLMQPLPARRTSRPKPLPRAQEEDDDENLPDCP